MHRTDKYSQNSSIIQASLAKWLSVRLRTKWLWGRISLLSIELRCRDSNEMCVTIFKYPDHISKTTKWDAEYWVFVRAVTYS